MDSLRHAFSKSRSSSASTSSPPLTAKTREPVSKEVGKLPQRGESMSSKRDSGIGRSMLSSLGSTNGRNHSRNPSGTSTRESTDKSITTNGSLNGMFPSALE